MSYDKKLYSQIKKYSVEGAEKYKVAAIKENSEKNKKEAPKKDPISHAFKESSKSPKKMFKESMGKLKKLTEKK